MGGGGFTMEERSPALDRLVLTLTGKPVPKICFLPTASGDGREQTTRFYERFSAWPCELSVLSLFALGRDRLDPREHLLAQDAVYIGGGSMRNMLAVWREHAVDAAMRTAWERGIVLAGLSAGAMCWFEGGVTMSGGYAAAARGMGLLPGSMSVHMDGEPERLPVFRQAIAAGKLPDGYGVDDGAALLFAGRRLSACVSSRSGARVIRIRSDGAGATTEQGVAVKPLPGTEHAAREGGVEGLKASDGVSELRSLRAGRHRWE